MFALNESSGDHALKFIFYELLTRYDLISRFKVNMAVLHTHTRFRLPRVIFKLPVFHFVHLFHWMLMGTDLGCKHHQTISQSNLFDTLTCPDWSERGTIRRRGTKALEPFTHSSHAHLVEIWTLSKLWVISRRCDDMLFVSISDSHLSSGVLRGGIGSGIQQA